MSSFETIRELRIEVPYALFTPLSLLWYGLHVGSEVSGAMFTRQRGGGRPGSLAVAERDDLIRLDFL